MFKKTIGCSPEVKKLLPSSPMDFQDLDSVDCRPSENQKSFVEVSFEDSDAEKDTHLGLRSEPQTSLKGLSSGSEILEEEKEVIGQSEGVHFSEGLCKKEEEKIRLLPVSSNDRQFLPNLSGQLSHSPRGSAKLRDSSKRQKKSKGDFRFASLQLDPSSKRATHEGIGCDECGIFPITGTRFRCISHCRADICSSCEKKTHLHLMLRIPNQVSEASLFKVLDRLQSDGQVEELETSPQKKENRLETSKIARLCE